jgi:hypothetical protein
MKGIITPQTNTNAGVIEAQPDVQPIHCQWNCIAPETNTECPLFNQCPERRGVTTNEY